jgi:hypothetical protein
MSEFKHERPVSARDLEGQPAPRHAMSLTCQSGEYLHRLDRMESFDCLEATRFPYAASLDHRPSRTKSLVNPISQVSYRRFQQTNALTLHDLAERRDESLCQPEGEDELGTGHE